VCCSYIATNSPFTLQRRVPPREEIQSSTSLISSASLLRTQVLAHCCSKGAHLGCIPPSFFSSCGSGWRIVCSLRNFKRTFCSVRIKRKPELPRLHNPSCESACKAGFSLIVQDSFTPLFLFCFPKSAHPWRPDDVIPCLIRHLLRAFFPNQLRARISKPTFRFLPFPLSASFVFPFEVSLFGIRNGPLNEVNPPSAGALPSPLIASSFPWPSRKAPPREIIPGTPPPSFRLGSTLS